MDKKKMLILVGGVVLIVLVIVLMVVFVIRKPNQSNNHPEESIGDDHTIQSVEPDQAMDMYEETTKTCDGVLVWDLQVGDSVPINDMNAVSGACQKDHYYSKMIGYTYDLENNVIIHVNVLKNEEGKLYKLDHTFVDDYSEETLDTSLNFGTTYEYVYQKDGDAYKLIRVQLMISAHENENIEENN